ncbi:MAG TPA: hypothetical protein VKV04_09485 [Verrucomicrobiae bacterium]|nr:hypothetical protein [Verrucomicrobiae bacterium]
MRKHWGMIVVLASMLVCKIASAQTNAVLFRLDDETKQILRKATTDSWFKKEAFTSALLGGLTAIAAAWLAYRWELRKERKAEQEFNWRVLDAIQIELKTLMEMYDSGTGAKIKDLKDGETFPYWLHFTQRHFVVFESNALHIGKIDPELASQIIRVYELLKVWVEGAGINSHHVRDQNQNILALRIHPTDHNLLQQKIEIHSLLVTQAKVMKELDGKIRFEVGEFFKRFDKLRQR